MTAPRVRRLPVTSAPPRDRTIVTGRLPRDIIMSQWDGYAGAEQSYDHWNKGAKVQERVALPGGGTMTYVRKLLPTDVRQVPIGPKGTGRSRWM